MVSGITFPAQPHGSRQVANVLVTDRLDINLAVPMRSTWYRTKHIGLYKPQLWLRT